jgi:hypothetical protein
MKQRQSRFRLFGIGSVTLAAVVMLSFSPTASASTTHEAVGQQETSVAVATKVSEAEYAKVRATATKLPGESDRNGTRGTLGASVLAGSPPNTTLPYDSTYEVRYSLNSGKRWQTSTARACIYIRSNGNQGGNITAEVRTDGGTRWGPVITFPQDGVTRNYCVTGLRTDYVYHVYLTNPIYRPIPGATGAITVTK